MFSIRLGRRGRGASAPGSSLCSPASPRSPECGPSPPWAPSVAPAPAGGRGLSGCARSWQSRIKMAPHTINKTPFLMTDLSHALGHWKERRRSTTHCDDDEEHTETESADDSASIKSTQTSPKKAAFAREIRDHHAQPLNAVFSFARAGLSSSKSLLERSLGKQHPRRYGTPAPSGRILSSVVTAYPNSRIFLSFTEPAMCPRATFYRLPQAHLCPPSLVWARSTACGPMGSR